MQEKHLTTQQLADRWGISPKTLERWRWAGISPKYLKISNRICYRTADIEEYEQNHLKEKLQRGKQNAQGVEHA